MRDLAFIATLLALLPLAVARPFAGVLLWCWISFMNPHRLVWGSASEMPWAVAVFGATLLGCLLAREPRRFQPNALMALFAMLAIAVTLTSLAALAPPEAVWAKWERTVKVIAGLLLTAALLNDRWRVHALVWVVVVSLGYFGVRGGLFTVLTGGAHKVLGPPDTMITDRNHLAAALLIGLPMMNYLRLHSAHRVVRVGLAVAMALTLMAVLGSHSRGGLLGLVAVAGVFWLRSRRKLAGAAVLAVALSAGVAFMPAHWVERMNGIATAAEEDASASTRLVLWGVSWKLALDRPLTGSGFAGPYTREVVDRVAPGGPARAVHSIWFEFLGEHGFPAFAVWLSVSGVALLYARRLARLPADRPDLAWARDLGRMAQVSVVAYAVSGTFLSLSYWDLYWTLLVAVGAAHALAMRALREGAGAAVAVPSTPARGWRGDTAAIPAGPRPPPAGDPVAAAAPGDRPVGWRGRAAVPSRPDAGAGWRTGRGRVEGDPRPPRDEEVPA